MVCLKTLTADELEQFDRITRALILDPICRDVRRALAEKYDVITPGSEHEGFRGLCDEASVMIMNKLNDVTTIERMDLNIKFNMVHGEQQHCPRIWSKDWAHEHTWVYVKFEDVSEIYFVDPTSEQFKFLYHDIPSYYIGSTPPKWFYPDIANPAYNKFFRKHKKIIKFLQYDLWGRISDLIHKLIYKRGDH